MRVDDPNRLQMRLYATVLFLISGVATVSLVLMVCKSVAMAQGWIISLSSPSFEQLAIAFGTALISGLTGYGLWHCRRWAQIALTVLLCGFLLASYPSMAIAILPIALVIWNHHRERKRWQSAVDRLDQAIDSTAMREHHSTIANLIQAGEQVQAVSAYREAAGVSYDVAVDVVRNWNRRPCLAKLDLLAGVLERSSNGER